jgi:N-acetylneuraminic acid mutarotase
MERPAGRFAFAVAIIVVSCPVWFAFSQDETVSGSWSEAGTLAASRAFCTATILKDGNVLVVGGHGGSGWPKVAELFDSKTGTWIPAGNTNESHSGHTSTLLQDGTVLVAGGYIGRYTGAAELYDPATDAWRSAGALRIPRDRHTATRFSDGRVAVAGGFTANGATNSIEIFDPATRTWHDGPPLPEPTAYHIAEPISDDSILFAGGEGQRQNYSHAVIYNWEDGTFADTGALALPHAYGETSVLLAPGVVLLAGGEPNTDERGAKALQEAERYDAQTGRWQPLLSMNVPRYFHTATLLDAGRVFVAGGYTRREQVAPQASCEIFDVASNEWRRAAAMNEGRAEHAAVRLPDGTVLVVGGQGRSGDALDTAELFTPH